MNKAGGGVAFMEAIALISFLAIVGIFVFAHLDRQSKDLDQQARELAEQIAPALKALFVENPELELDNQRVQSLPGVRMPLGFKVEVVRGANRADNWELRVWHPEGTRFFMVNSQGIQQKYL